MNNLKHWSLSVENNIILHLTYPAHHSSLMFSLQYKIQGIYQIQEKNKKKQLGINRTFKIFKFQLLLNMLENRGPIF
jgi:hypothetical protein